MNKNKKLEKRYYYLAGIIDGEGCFCLSETKDGKVIRAYPKIIVTNLDKDLILWLKKEFGGYFCINHRLYKGKGVLFVK